MSRVHPASPPLAVRSRSGASVPALGRRKPPAPPRGESYFWLHWMVEVGATVLLLSALALHKTQGFAPPYLMLAASCVAVSIPVYALCDPYHPRSGAIGGLARLTLAWCSVLSVLLAIGFATKSTGLYSREIIALWAFLGLGVQGSLYLLLQRWTRQRRAQRGARTRAAIIGTGALALELAQRLRRGGCETVAGVINADLSTPSTPSTAAPLLGSLDQLDAIVAAHHISRLYLALPLEHSARVKALYLQLLDAQVDVVWVPDLAGVLLLNHSVTDIDGLPAIKLNESPLTSHPDAARIKAVMDFSLALLGIIALSPLLLTVAALIKLSSPGPVVFRQLRHGWNGQIIEVWKFRSMHVHDSAHVRQATRNDPRITRIGRFIRRSSIDELPQLFNVLQGQLALVGPRPHALAHNNYYATQIVAYMARHRIKPGITGLAQVSGSRGETDTLEKMEKRIELDLAYINNWSLWLDIKILIKTPFTLLGKDIY